jgi:simple sugar transport system ATP-binding protein
MALALEMRGITKRFPGVTANEQVDFQLATGEIHALLGENGAGKTTLMRILYGLCRPDEGDMLVHGVPVQFASPRDAMTCGIGMVHQHFMLVPALTVTENIILGQEPARRWPFLDVPQAVQHIRQLAMQYHLDVDPQALIQDLPIGLRQRVEILKALYRQATILILDEPTAVLTPGEAEHLFDTLTTLAQHGTSIIFITHKLREVFRIAQRLTVLRRGQAVGTLTPAETTAPQLAALMVGETPPTPVVQHVHTVSAQVVLEVRDIEVRDDQSNLTVALVSLTVHAGEILGIAGVQGNGQTELIEALAGLRHAVAGSIVLQGVDVTRATPRQLTVYGVAHIPEDRHKHGMVEPYTIADNLVLNTYYRQPFANRMVRRAAAIVAHAAHLMQAFDIRAPHPAVPAGSLSGGNQQKMVIARECSRPLTLLLAAHPTRGLDIAATAFIHQHLVQQREQGCAVVLVSADLDELLTLADRIAVMYRGKLLAIVAAHEASRETLGQWMAGVPMPEP